MLRMDIGATFFIIPQLVQANVSLERISDFLYNVCNFAAPSWSFLTVHLTD